MPAFKELSSEKLAKEGDGKADGAGRAYTQQTEQYIAPKGAAAGAGASSGGYKREGAEKKNPS